MQPSCWHARCAQRAAAAAAAACRLPPALLSTPPLTPPSSPSHPPLQAARASTLQHTDSARIAVGHVGPADLACTVAFPALGAAPQRAATGAWAAPRMEPAPAPVVVECPVDAVDVAPRTPTPRAASPSAPCLAYCPPARRPGASPAVLAGCRLPHPVFEACTATATAAATTAPLPAYVPPQRRTAEQAAAAAAAPRPGRPCAFPSLTANPQPQPSAAPFSLYLLALLYPVGTVF